MSYVKGWHRNLAKIIYNIPKYSHSSDPLEEYLFKETMFEMLPKWGSFCSSLCCYALPTSAQANKVLTHEVWVEWK